MTDNEIIKALECCRDCKCKECPCYNKETDGCKEIDEQDILNLINRQKAEIERLEEMLDSSVSSERNAVDNIDYEKTEAIKEFAERLEDLSTERLLYEGYGETKLENIIICTDIDNLVKEMTEGKNE